jgi:hypothetical protein
MKRALVVCSLFWMVGCKQDTPSGNPDLTGAGNDDLSVNMNEDGGEEDMAVNVGDLASSCKFLGEACAGAGECCSGDCDTTTHICSVGMCKAQGASCTSSNECCSLACTGGQCSTTCKADQTACGGDGECCSGACVGGSCQPLRLDCRTSGNPCTAINDAGTDAGSGNCCSGLCENGTCSRNVSYCTQIGDVCFQGADCCTGICEKAAGATAGLCADLKSSVSCVFDGLKCNGCGDCCSRLCAPFAGSTVPVCQPASGCRVQGNLCHKDSDCCGGGLPDAGTPGAGTVECKLIDGAGGLGFCRSPTGGGGGGNACNPEGNVCHFQNYACSISSAPANCCACISGKECCVLDKVGIPRCNAINPNDGGTCVPAGGNCAFSDNCCGGLPCVPHSTGQLKCGVGTDGGMCVPEGGPCTATADCCSGVTCIIPVGSLVGTCTNLTDPPMGDMGPAPVCSEVGQSCAVNACCAGLECRNDSGLCGATGADCFCLGKIG